jgi:hypothetical protein
MCAWYHILNRSITAHPAEQLRAQIQQYCDNSANALVPPPKPNYAEGLSLAVLVSVVIPFAKSPTLSPFSPFNDLCVNGL